jgi:hypothetical protein
MDADPFAVTAVPLRENQNKNLSDQIIDEYQKSKFDPDVKHFVPEGSVDRLVTLEAIIKELLEKDQLEPADLVLEDGSVKKGIVDFAYGEAKKVFATTVVSGLRGNPLVRAMWQFKQIQFIDTSLPFLEENSSIDPFFSNTRGSPWNKTRIHNFCREQWGFLAPVFSRQNFNVDLEARHILPFIERDDLKKEGAFAQVFRVEIHEAHQKDPALNVRPLYLFCCTYRENMK